MRDFTRNGRWAVDIADNGKEEKIAILSAVLTSSIFNR
jgi:hypothetical protein